MRAEFPVIDARVKYEPYEDIVYFRLIPNGPEWKRPLETLSQPHDLENFIQMVRRKQKR